MSTEVITVSSGTSVGDALKMMKEHEIHRLPVVDDGRLVGIVNEERLERVKPRTQAPVLWQLGYVLSHTTVADVMRKTVITVKPGDTLERGVARAQQAKVGMLMVVDHGKLVGVATTNDFFYKIVNPTLGIGEPGSRIKVGAGGDGKSAEAILAAINRMGIETRVIWAIVSPVTGTKDLTLQLAVENPSPVVVELQKLGFPASVVER